MPTSERKPADAFALLADDIRLDIVEALVDHAYESMDEPLSFSDLRRTVGVDDAGKFNYHLGKLQPQFVEKGEDGYTPRFAALEAVGAARAGTLTELPDERRATLDIDCTECGNSLTAIHRGSSLRIECEGDDSWFYQTIVPPRTAAVRSVPEVARYTFRDMQREVEKLTDGVCMICGGPVDTALPAEDTNIGNDEGITVEFDCTNCSYRLQIPVGLALVRHPAVVAHHWNHGIDVRDEAPFTMRFVNPAKSSIEQEQPFRARVRYTIDDDTLTLSVDAALNTELVEDE